MLDKIKSFIKCLIDSKYRASIKKNKRNAKVSEIYIKYKDLNDEEYLKRLYKARTGKRLNLDNPKTFNEKLQWLKIHNRKPIYTTMVDKYAVKKFVADKIGEQHVIPLYGVWDKFDDIVFDNLPNQFVLKTTHNSGGIIICKDKSAFDIKKAKEKIENWLKSDSFSSKREWPYKDVPHRIIAEKYMTDCSGQELKDYKFFCFDGKVRILYVTSEKIRPHDSEIRVNYFDSEFNSLKICNGGLRSKNKIDKPVNFEKMKAYAQEFSEGVPFLRVDFYEINGEIYFGEFTFFHWSGFSDFRPKKWDRVLGEMVDLSLIK